MKYVPMLAETMPKSFTEMLNRFIEHPDHAIEQKMDGHRVVFVVKDGICKPYNRRGESFRQYVPDSVFRELSDPNVFRDNQAWVFDGEMLDDTYYIFDLLSTPSGDTMDLPFRERRRQLEAIFEAWEPFHITLVAHANTPALKRAILDEVEAIGGEGVMIKDLCSHYAPGERSVAWLKHKLWASADVIVTARHPEGKRSVEVAVFDGKTLHGVGSVSVADRWLNRLEVGDVIEAKYLNRGNGGHLYQPSFLRQRTDKNPYECTVDQLKPVNRAAVTIE